MSELRKCEALGCEDLAAHVGLCNMHYQANKGVDVRLVVYARARSSVALGGKRVYTAPTKICAALGCGNSAYNGLMCSMHKSAELKGHKVREVEYKRRNAKPRAIIPRRADGMCAALGCSEPASRRCSLCPLHSYASSTLKIDVLAVLVPRKKRRARTASSDGTCAVQGCVRLPTSGKITCSRHATCNGWHAELYDRALDAQRGRCAICDTIMHPPHRDHDHITGAARGLLCRRCNSQLGQFEMFRPLSTPATHDTPAQRAACEPFERYLRNTPVMQLEALREPEAAE